MSIGLNRLVAAQPYPVWFATNREAHVLTLGAVVELQAAHDTSQLPELPCDETRNNGSVRSIDAKGSFALSSMPWPEATR